MFRRDFLGSLAFLPSLFGKKVAKKKPERIDDGIGVYKINGVEYTVFETKLINGVVHFYRYMTRRPLGDEPLDFDPTVSYSPVRHHSIRNGTKEEWWLLTDHGPTLHRENGPALTTIRELDDGSDWQTQTWFYLGQRHREGGPARTFTKFVKKSREAFTYQKEEWFKHGLLHREDGPATTLTCVRSPPYQQWFLNGKFQYDTNAMLFEQPFRERS